MPKEPRAPAVQPENEIARRVRRFERALLCIVRMRHEEERTVPVTPAEHALAAQVSECVTLYERGLRRTPTPPPPVPPPEPAPKAAPAPVEDRPKRARRKRRAGNGRRKPRATRPAAPAVG